MGEDTDEMNIVICEDDKIYCDHIKQVLESYIHKTKSNSRIALVAKNADAVIEYAQNNSEVTLYFLDIKLGGADSGFDIAMKIRGKDRMSHIVFVTNYAELMPMSYEYKAEALDYIVKDGSDETNRKIIECVEHAEKRQKTGYEQCLNIRNKRNNFSVPFEEICYIASVKSSHKLVLYYENGIIEFYGSLKEVEKQLDERFMRCHKSIIVNKDKIIGADKSEHTLMLADQYKCEYSPKYKGVLEKWN